MGSRPSKKNCKFVRNTDEIRNDVFILLWSHIFGYHLILRRMSLSVKVKQTETYTVCLCSSLSCFFTKAIDYRYIWPEFKFCNSTISGLTGQGSTQISAAMSIRPSSVTQLKLCSPNTVTCLQAALPPYQLHCSQNHISLPLDLFILLHE